MAYIRYVMAWRPVIGYDRRNNRRKCRSYYSNHWRKFWPAAWLTWNEEEKKYYRKWKFSQWLTVTQCSYIPWHCVWETDDYVVAVLAVMTLVKRERRKRLSKWGNSSQCYEGQSLTVAKWLISEEKSFWYDLMCLQLKPSLSQKYDVW
jgi:hypothetical protein